MATVTPDNLTVKFNLKGSVILDISTYNELRLHADLYDRMMRNCIENFEVVDREPSSWSPAACKVDGNFEIPTGIMNAVINSIISQILNNDTWMESIAKGGECWLDLIEGSFTSYKPNGVYSYYLLDNKQFADKYFSLQKKEDDSND